MKEDYLWDKTGDDAEIKGLENALKAFRYTETAPPELPQKVFTVEKPKRGRFFQFGFAFAAFAAVVIIVSVVWLQTAYNKIPAENIAANAPAAEEFTAANPEPAPFVKTETAPQPSKPKVVRIQQANAPKIRPHRAILRTTAPKEPAETLTAEEKYAYDQLMLALSITGSKLKIVKDKINGIEDQNAALDAAK